MELHGIVNSALLFLALCLPVCDAKRQNNVGSLESWGPCIWENCQYGIQTKSDATQKCSESYPTSCYQPTPTAKGLLSVTKTLEDLSSGTESTIDFTKANLLPSPSSNTHSTTNTKQMKQQIAPTAAMSLNATHSIGLVTHDKDAVITTQATAFEKSTSSLVAAKSDKHPPPTAAPLEEPDKEDNTPTTQTTAFEKSTPSPVAAKSDEHLPTTAVPLEAVDTKTTENDFKEFNVDMKIDKEFTPELNDKTSEEFRRLEQTCIEAIVKTFEGDTSFVKAEVNEFFPGSIIISLYFSRGSSPPVSRVQSSLEQSSSLRNLGMTSLSVQDRTVDSSSAEDNEKGLPMHVYLLIGGGALLLFGAVLFLYSKNNGECSLHSPTLSEPSMDSSLEQACSSHSKDIVSPYIKWLGMEAKQQQKHIQHAKNCILSPFLFKRKNEYSEKILVWLHQRDLLPNSRSFDCLTDKHIEVCDYAEEVADLILSEMTRQEFLYDVFQVSEQLKECNLLTEVLCIAEDSELVKLLWCSSTWSDKLRKEDLLLVLMSVLNQALYHITMASDKSCDHLANFEKKTERHDEICEGLRLRGNQYFKDKQFKQASVFYTKAINLKPFDAVLYSNRAQTYLNTTQFREALSDARRAICLNPTWEKSSQDRHTSQSTSSKYKTKKAKLGGRSSSSNSKRKRLDSLGKHRQLPHLSDEDSDDDMPELLPDSVGDNPRHDLLPDEDDGIECTCEYCTDQAEFDSFPSFVNGPSLCDCVGNDCDDDDDDSSESSDLPLLHSGIQLFIGGALVLDLIRQFLEAHPEMEGDDTPPGALPEVIESLPRIKITTQHTGSPLVLLAIVMILAPRWLTQAAHRWPTQQHTGSSLVLLAILMILAPRWPTQQHTDNGSSCPICQCDFEVGEEAARLPCNHTYHLPCVTTWLKMLCLFRLLAPGNVPDF
ncbi:predicted protein [Nematostella vectensis]|uniref:RING-type domain-containing protein n=1 Tax=Nematostella vectensis TaxID=45351 RepID=A7RP79_NEMVE|nr:predicted protein [Nematostella vectensis]|eukprot:XP_001638703.1 predicted protein [Nematostella vectensis]